VSVKQGEISHGTKLFLQPMSANKLGLGISIVIGIGVSFGVALNHTALGVK
jgi:hypothetical protein